MQLAAPLASSKLLAIEQEFLTKVNHRLREQGVSLRCIRLAGGDIQLSVTHAIEISAETIDSLAEIITEYQSKSNVDILRRSLVPDQLTYQLRFADCCRPTPPQGATKCEYFWPSVFVTGTSTLLFLGITTAWS